MVPRRNVNFTPHKKNWLNRENKRSLKIIGSAFSWFSFFLLLTLLLGNPVLATDYPPYRSFLGVHFQQGPGSKIIIDQISPDSPATQAGLKPGDVLLAIDGQPVNSIDQATELIAFHPPYDKVELEIERQAQPLKLTATLIGRLRLEAITPPKMFFIPGIDTEAQPAISHPVQSLDSINVLTQVLLDPLTGNVEFVGRYDPAYKTGPLPYAQLLQAALQTPEASEPGFSLDLDPETLKQNDELYSRKEADITNIFGPTSSAQQISLWFRRWVDFILGHPLLEIDRQIFIERLAQLYGLTKNELVEILNYTNLSKLSSQVPSYLVEVQARLIKNIGYHTAAEAYRLLRQSSQDSLFKAAATLGQENEARKILDAPEIISKPQAEKLSLLKAFIICQIARNLNFFNDQQANFYFLQFKQGKLDLDNLDAWLQRRLIPDKDSSGNYLIYQALSGLPLSNELLYLFYGVSVPQSLLRFKKVSPESALGQVLYEADYTLKTIDLNQEIYRSIKNHRTIREIFLEWGGKYGLKNLTPTRLWLEPQEVNLFPADDKKEIGFGPARVVLKAEALSGLSSTSPTFTPEEVEATQKITDIYASQISQDYELYAREYPALHKLRETAKILALAKWLRQEKMEKKLQFSPLSSGSDPGEINKPYWKPPARVPGLYHVFMKIEPVKTESGQLKYSILISQAVEGGVNFATKKNWVVVGPKPPSYEPATTSLTASAILARAAVTAAASGDLEKARTLAEKSAEAMQGQLKLSELPADLPKPQAVIEAVASPEAVRLVKESAKIVYSLTATKEERAGKTFPSPEQIALLQQLNQELGKINSGLPVASDFLKALQTRQTMPGYPGGRITTSEPPQPGVTQVSKPVFDCESYLKQYETPEAGADLGPRQQKLLASRIAEINHQLEIINQAVENLSRLNQQNLDELQKWEKEITRAYETAQDRLIDAVGLLLVDGPLEILQKRQQEMKEAINSGLFTSLLARKAALTEQQAAAFDQQVFTYLKLKYQYENIYGRAEQLQKRLSEAKAVYDLDQWANSEKSDYEKLKDGLWQLTEMMLNEPAVGGAIKLGKITGENLLRWLSLYKAVSAASGFFWDIMQQKFAFEPVMKELLKSIDQNREALEKLRLKAQLLREQLKCLENKKF